MLLLILFILAFIWMIYEIKHAPLLDEDENGNLIYHENKKSK